MSPRLIRNAALHISDVPDVYAPGLDPVGFTEAPHGGESGPEWAEIWDFALTFDGYRYFGADEGAALRLQDFAKSVNDAFRNDNQLPKIDLAFLRACLFFEQRQWCKHSWVARCPPELATYLDALLRAIRANIS